MFIPASRLQVFVCGSNGYMWRLMEELNLKNFFVIKA
jgi:hypothetical protein